MFEAVDVFKIFQKFRGDAVVVPSGISSEHWHDISTNPRRDAAVAETMGGPITFALGLALAQPDVKVVLFDSEGSLLMTLGVLATVAGMRPRNFYHFLLDNECYATTGGQPVPNAESVSYEEMARAAGYAASYSFDELEDLANNVERVLDEPGPVFVSMKIVPEIETKPIHLRTLRERRAQAEVIRDLRQELGISVG